MNNTYDNGGQGNQYNVNNFQKSNIPNYQYHPMNSFTPPPISILGWIGRSILLTLLAIIPIVGWLVQIIMLFVWSGDGSKDMTFRNWAKAQLVVLAAVIILAIFIVIISCIIASSL